MRTRLVQNRRATKSLFNTEPRQSEGTEFQCLMQTSFDGITAESQIDECLSPAESETEMLAIAKRECGGQARVEAVFES